MTEQEILLSATISAYRNLINNKIKTNIVALIPSPKKVAKVKKTSAAEE
jgi:hypothetical protein